MLVFEYMDLDLKKVSRTSLRRIAAQYVDDLTVHGLAR